MGLTACTSKEEMVYLFIYDMNDPYIEALGNEIMRLGEAYYPMELHDAQNSQLIQNERIEEVLKDKPKLLIINPVDRLGAYPIIEKAKEYGVPIIFIKREPLERDLSIFDQTYYVGADAKQSGILQAEIVSELFGSNPSSLNSFDKNNDDIIQMIIFKGEQGHQDAELRTEYIQSELEKSGYQLEILTTEIANWNQVTAYNRALTVLDEYAGMYEVIVSNNDAMAIGVIQAMIEKGIFIDENVDGYINHETESWIPVIGIDGIDSAVEWMRSGYLYATVLNDAIGQANATIALSRVLLLNEDAESLGIEIVNGKYVWVDYTKYTLEDN